MAGTRDSSASCITCSPGDTHWTTQSFTNNRKPNLGLGPSLFRAVLTRGGSSSDVTDSADDEEWLKVTSVADVRSALSPKDEATISDETNATNPETLEEEEVDAEVPPVESSEGSLSDTEPTVDTIASLTFGASKPGDGSESDPDGLPVRFLKMQKGHREKARKAFAHTLEWRAEHNIDTILFPPRPLYDLCKSIFPHYFPGRDVLNNPILVQRPGLLDLEKAHKYNITMDELLMDFVFALEYCWNIMEPGPPDGVMTTVVDMTGVSLKHIRNGEMRDFILRSIHVISENYPQRSFRTLVINTPRWFGGLFKIIKPLLRESTKKKMEILMRGKNQDNVLRKYLGDASLPRDLLTVAEDNESDLNDEDGNTSDPGPNSSIEQEIRAFVLRRLEQNSMEMFSEPGEG
eukprot:CAMPEP_0197449330 /NCGR_PEP_ID=MMETSP1175-20131217/21032_1 /TAXON_ID=1003142 /ORGANISM="Triceratium dubium, Strain CCMP147" /LENGTH=404 /DNA_ID=CAMNT_0042981425 /DNA_START=435 /DNA_END=1649 /DNA_ORIENTATION=+